MGKTICDKKNYRWNENFGFWRHINYKEMTDEYGVGWDDWKGEPIYITKRSDSLDKTYWGYLDVKGVEWMVIWR